MSDISTSRKGGRSKSGCQTCRARKVRCDENPGKCFNCERLGLPCSGTTQTSDPSQTNADGMTGANLTTGIKRKRTFRSCLGCRATKTRCSGDKPACNRCRHKSLQCDYDDSSEPAWKQQLKLSETLRSGSARDILDRNLSPQKTEYSEHHAAMQQDRSSSRRTTQEEHDSRSHDEHWLQSIYLPDNDKIHGLVEYYFINVHPLRCFGFLHKPSFMQRLDAEDGLGRDDDALLHIVCALGALFFAVENQSETESPATTLAAGSQWAKKAQQLILGQLGNIAVEKLMAAVLLHDYHLRMSNFGDAFMLSGLIARMTQSLQINLEHSTDILCKDSVSGPSASTKESRRRLLWCCYISDSLVGSGVDQLTLIKEADIKIQLPCNERNFLLQSACITEVLEPGQFLKFLEPESLPSSPADNMGIRAYFVRYVAIRRNVLKYIKHLNTAKLPWLPDSEFAQLDGESRAWYSALPASLKFTPTAIYIRKETQQLGALLSLHYMYHQTMCDLYRIGAPELYKLRSGFDFPPEQYGFLTHLRSELFVHARSMATITSEALRHGPHAFADSWTPTMVYDCCRVILYYLTQLIDPAAERSRAVMFETIPLIRSNIRALKMMQSMYSVAELLSTAAEKMLEKVGVGSETSPTGHNIIPDDPYQSNETEEVERSAPGTPVQSAPDYVLNPLSIYRMARKAIPEKHAPEKQPHANSPTATASSRSSLQRRAKLQHVPSDMTVEDAAPTQDNSFGVPQSQCDFDDLLSLFASDPSGWTWQPSDTAIGSQLSNGLPPWEPTYVDQQLDAWMPMFSGQTQQYGFQ